MDGDGKGKSLYFLSSLTVALSAMDYKMCLQLHIAIDGSGEGIQYLLSLDSTV